MQRAPLTPRSRRAAGLRVDPYGTSRVAGQESSTEHSGSPARSLARFAVLLLAALALRDALFRSAGLPEAERFFSWHTLAELTSLIGIL